jgi:SAM-dependent methyltransferase
MADQTAEIRNYFDAVAPEYVRDRERQYSFVAQRDLVLDLLPAGCERILDIGCGPAVMADELLKRCNEVCGIDAAAQMIALGEARLRGHPQGHRAHLRAGGVEQLPYADGSFDAIVAMGVLEYVLDRGRALAEMNRVLRPGGVVVITVPSCVSSYHLALGAWEGARRLAKRALGRPPARSERFVTRRCIPWRLDRQLERAGLHKAAGRFCNFIFFPLHEMHAGLSLALNRRLSWLADKAPGAVLGTQYVVKAVKG